MCTCSASAVVSCRANWAALCLPIVGCKPSLEDARRRLAEECIGSYSECDDNLARINVYDGREDEDYLYELVFDRTTGKLLYGRADGSLQRCDGMGGADDSATHISAAGPAPVLSGCVDCRFCAPSSEAASGFGDF
jgi:hypothetical protein